MPTKATSEINPQEQVAGLQDLTIAPMQVQEEPLPAGEIDTSPQIYLNRNLKLMRTVREKDHQI